MAEKNSKAATFSTGTGHWWCSRPVVIMVARDTVDFGTKERVMLKFNVILFLFFAKNGMSKESHVLHGHYLEWKVGLIEIFATVFAGVGHLVCFVMIWAYVKPEVFSTTKIHWFKSFRNRVRFRNVVTPVQRETLWTFPRQIDAIPRQLLSIRGHQRAGLGIPWWLN